MTDEPKRRSHADSKPDSTYLAPVQPARRARETSDERRARQRDEVANQQADLKREAAERRKG